MAHVSALLERSTNLSLTTSTLTPVPWENAVHDEANFWSAGDPTKLVVPPGITEVIVTAYAAFPDNGTGDRWILVLHNNTTEVASMLLPESPVSDNDRIYAQTPLLKVTAGDYFTVQVWQSSGTSLNLLSANTTFFSIEAYGEPIITRPTTLIKPARWTLRGPRMQDSHRLRNCLALFPLWDGGGPDAVELMRYAGAAYHAQWEATPNWGVGRAGRCTVHNGTDTGGLNVTGSFTSLSKLKPQLPITMEVLVEPFAALPVEQGNIFCNDGSRSAHAGFMISQTAAGAWWAQYGDGTGATSSDRRSFNTPAGGIRANTIYHVIATIYSQTEAKIWVNGVSQSLTPTGSAGTTVGYSSNPARIGSAGAMGTNNTGFNGRIYMAALYARGFNDLEAALHARDPYAPFRRLSMTRQYANFEAPPPLVTGSGRPIIMVITS